MNELLKVTNLKTYFYTLAGTVQAVRGIDFSLNKGEALGIVGESGCGKTVTGLSIMRLISFPPGKIVDGRIEFNNTNILNLNEKEITTIRGDKISMIFQDPMSSLNPVLTIGDQMMEPLIVHKNYSTSKAWNRALELLDLVKIKGGSNMLRRYPHEFSGGMRQRVMIAMALSCEPQIIIADEPTTSLDVTVQAQILELLKDIRGKIETSIILITHNLAVVAGLCDRVLVFYAGKIVEEAFIDDLYSSPLHPYTVGLLKAVPRLNISSEEKLKTIPGLPPDLISPPNGCSFHPRCEYAMKICAREEPPFFNFNNSRRTACWLYYGKRDLNS
ncbi:MAG TPA: ABC transporter ATP-binding protein [Caldisericia bacterium]|nr:ABC transporter ATP-binding protein [Caldisericia bacterium]HPO29042.1 ABC transporter ATP-binding protein [Caldisericia bacterium]HXK70792.1 ABC transporter ATP-binding protein [Caldisericia bacterium]